MHNYTPIDELVKKHNEMKYGVGSVSKEFNIPNSQSEKDEQEAPVEQKTTPEEVEKYITPIQKQSNFHPTSKKWGYR